jgi:hypothetical protein
MKHNMKSLYILLFTAFFLGSCNKFDDDINIDPNLPSQASGTQLIANAQLFLPGLSSSPQGEFMAQYLAETQYPGASQYPEGETSFYGLYQGPLMNLQAVLDAKNLSATEGPVANQLAVAKILKAYFFWHITDRWGDVPYTEALSGEKNFKPKYDTQESIYNSLFGLLEEASNQIVAGSITNDIMYKGDMTKWKKLANTIRLLMALRLSEVNPTKGAAEFNKALEAGIMTSNADNFVFAHLADANNQNYWYGQIKNQNREWWALTKTLVNYMKPLNDPRLPVYGRKATTGGDYVGLDFGTTVGIPNTTTVSLLGAALFEQNAPVQLVTYAQALFAKAEAAKRGWITGGDVVAKTNYDLAIEQSVRQWTGGTTGLAAMMADPEVAYNPARALEQIGNQRYIHLFMHGYEAWAEWRRTGFPKNLVAPGGRAVPNRNSYPSSEKFNNTENYQEAIQRQWAGQDNIYGKVWWDK